MQIADDVEVGQTVENTANFLYQNGSGSSTVSIEISSSDDNGEGEGDDGDDDIIPSTPSV